MSYFDNLIGWVKIQTMMCIPLKQTTQEWPTCQTGFFMHKKRTFQITTCYIAQYLWLILVLFILCLVQLENKCVWSLIIGPKYIAWRNNWDKFNPWMHQLAFGHINCLFRSVSVLIFPNESWYSLIHIFVLWYSELTQIVTDVVADPTLPRTEDHLCPKWVNFSLAQKLFSTGCFLKKNK